MFLVKAIVKAIRQRSRNDKYLFLLAPHATFSFDPLNGRQPFFVDLTMHLFQLSQQLAEEFGLFF